MVSLRQALSYLKLLPSSSSLAPIGGGLALGLTKAAAADAAAAEVGLKTEEEEESVMRRFSNSSFNVSSDR